jgi:hypothetical protein
MRDLVDFAHLLGLAAGGASGALEAATRLLADGVRVFGPLRDDQSRLLARRAAELGLVDGAGSPDAARCAELIVVCDMISRIPVPPATRLAEPRIVFTTPNEAASVVEPHQRLDLLVEDVIRMSTHEVVLGGPFWNDAGFTRLLELLTPAVETRGVSTTFYVHTPDERDRGDHLSAWASSVTAVFPSRIRWYHGPQHSLMHAKFVIADRCRGYLGSANLTSLGLSHHIEMGVELTEVQATQLCSFMERLDAVGLFRADRGSAEA